jgi:triacylglycerol lipase
MSLLNDDGGDVQQRPATPEAAGPGPRGCAPPPAGIVEALTDGVRYLTRTLGTPAGLRGLALESVWCTTHLAGYPLGLLREQLEVDSGGTHYRTDSLSTAQRSLLVSDLGAAGTPVLLVHGLMDNRSVFTLFRRELRGRGFGVVHSVSYSPLTTDVRSAAYELRRQVAELRERTGAERVHIVGHSLGGLIARYFVQRLGGDEWVHTVATLGTPHGGTLAAYLVPTPLMRQLVPGSDLMRELARPAPGCRTRFLVAWSPLDQLVLPQRGAQLEHPDLRVETLRLDDAGHMSLSVHPRAVDWVAGALAEADQVPAAADQLPAAADPAPAEADQDGGPDPVAGPGDLVTDGTGSGPDQPDPGHPPA